MTTGSGSTHSWVTLKVLKKYPGIYTPAILYEIIISSTLLRIYFFCLFFLKKLVVIGYKAVQIKKDTDIYKASQ